MAPSSKLIQKHYRQENLSVRTSPRRGAHTDESSSTAAKAPEEMDLFRRGTFKPRMLVERRSVQVRFQRKACLSFYVIAKQNSGQ